MSTPSETELGAPDYGMREMEPSHCFSMPCTNPDCGGDPQHPDKAPIRPGISYMIDTIRNRTYCMTCGSILRYHRKKWSQRGEEMPRTFWDIKKRHEAT